MIENIAKICIETYMIIINKLDVDKYNDDMILTYAENFTFLDIHFCIYLTFLLYEKFENSISLFFNCSKLKLFKSFCLLMFLMHFQL